MKCTLAMVNSIVENTHLAEVIGLKFSKQVIFTIITDGFTKDRKINDLAIRHLVIIGIRVIIVSGSI
jgi:hypothetical protein